MLRFVVMAAGKASRMGQDKLAMPWGNTTILGHVLNTLRESINLLNKSLSLQVFVVARKSPLEYGLGEQGNFPANVDFHWLRSHEGQPLADTIRSGLTNWSDEIRGVCFVPGDQVGMDPQTLAEMVQLFMDKEPDFLVPKDPEVTGSPVFFHARYSSDLMNLQGEQGGKHVLKRYSSLWVTFPVKEGFLLDIDTMSEYLETTIKLNGGR